MFIFFTFFHEVHSPKFPHIVVNQIGSIGHHELDMVMFLWFEVLVFKKVFTLHAKMGDNRVSLKLKNKVLTVTINSGELLTNEKINEIIRSWVFDNIWVEGFYVFDCLWFWKHYHLL